MDAEKGAVDITKYLKKYFITIKELTVIFLFLPMLALSAESLLRVKIDEL